MLSLFSLLFGFQVWSFSSRDGLGAHITSAGKANDSGYFALLALGSHPRHILPR